MVKYHGKFPWENTMVNYHGKSSWFITMVSCHELVPRTFAAQIWQILAKNIFLVKKIYFRTENAMLSHNFDFCPKLKVLTKIGIFGNRKISIFKIGKLKLWKIIEIFNKKIFLVKISQICAAKVRSTSPWLLPVIYHEL